MPAVLSLAAAPLHASASVPPYQLTVSLSTTTMTYGGTSPVLRASLVPPAGDPPLGAAPYYFSVAGQNLGGTMTTASAPYGLFLNSLAPIVLDAGQYAVTANYQSPNYGLLTSAPVTLTVQPITPSFECTPATGGAYTLAPGASIPMSTSGVAGGSVTVTFSGAQSFTSAPRPLDANGAFSVTAPPATGQYTYRCDYSGSRDYTSASASYPNIITISANHSVAGIALYTDPAPLQSYTPTTWEVVVTGGPGLPAPTGNVSISIGNSFIRPLIQLGAGGVATFEATSPAADAIAGITVDYQGDSVYTSAAVHLSIDTAPIPHGSGATARAQSSTGTATTPQASPTGDASPSPEGSPSPDPTAIQVIKAPAMHAASAVAGRNLLGFAIAAIALIAVIGAVTAWLWRRRQAMPVRTPSSRNQRR